MLKSSLTLAVHLYYQTTTKISKYQNFIIDINFSYLPLVKKD